MAIHASWCSRKPVTQFKMLLVVAGCALTSLHSFALGLAIDGVNEAAWLTACGFADPPTRTNPFVQNDAGLLLDDPWRWEAGNPRTRNLRVDSSLSTAPVSRYPLCELWAMKKLSGPGVGLETRCKKLQRENAFQAFGSGSGTRSFSALDKFEGDEMTGGSAQSYDLCDEYSSSSAHAFACAFLKRRDALDQAFAKQNEASVQVVQICQEELRRASLNPSMPGDYRVASPEYRRNIEAGVDWRGGAYCAPQGPIIVQQQESLSRNILNFMTAAVKTLPQQIGMYNIAKMGKENEARAMDHNAKLGFPSAVDQNFTTQAFTNGGLWGGGLWGGGAGGGLWSGGAGGGLWGGAGGGVCGVPPYAPWYSGCGQVGGGIYGAGGQIGAGWGGGFGGMPYGSGFQGHPYGLGFGTNAANFPSPFGTLNGGGQWNPNGGFGQGFYGNNGAGAFPGPYGTLNGGNGWPNGGALNPWGANGNFGQAPFWGSNNPGNADLLGAQAGYYERMAAQARQNAQKAQSALSIVEKTEEDIREIQKKHSQATLAYQMATQGMAMGETGFNTGPAAVGVGASPFGLTQTPNYYPALNQGGTPQFSLSGSYRRGL